MKIVLKKLKLTNFKGIRDLTIDFDSRITNIYGDNGTGKTTIFDAWLWLLFGKDSTDRDDTNFQIKTIERDRVIDKIEHTVEADIVADGKEYNIVRTLREVWRKPRGKENSEFSGNETIYFWNGVPKKASEFKASIATLIDEGVFKLLTNTSYFNGKKWQDRRSILTEMAGAITKESIAGTNPNFLKLLEELKQYKTLEEFRKSINASKNKIKAELDLIPARIDEANLVLRDIPDFANLRIERESIQQELIKIDAIISKDRDAFKDLNNLIVSKQSEVYALQHEIEKRKNEIKTAMFANRTDRETKIAELKNRKRIIDSALANLSPRILSIESSIKRLTEELQRLRAAWTKINEQQFQPKELVFDEADCACPVCKRRYDEQIIFKTQSQRAQEFEQEEQQRLNQFNQLKAQQIAENTSQGKLTKQSLDEQQAFLIQANKEREEAIQDLAAFNEKIQQLEIEHTSLSNSENQDYLMLVENDSEIKSHNLNISVIESEIEALQHSKVSPSKDYSADKKIYQSQLEEIDSKLGQEKIIQQSRDRIKELNSKERQLSSDLALLEQQEFHIEQFQKLEMDIVEKNVNQFFSLVKFRMFDTTNDGNEFPACITLVDGVPFPDANNASKINAGLDIINSLSKFYGVVAPVFIDNAESVTELIDSEAQIIRLVVSEPDKKLRIELPKAKELFAIN